MGIFREVSVRVKTRVEIFNDVRDDPLREGLLDQSLGKRT